MTVPSSSSLPDFLSEPSFTTIKQAFPVITTISLAIVALISFVVFTQRSKYPIANAPAWLELTTLRRMKYMKDGHTVLDNALKQYGEKPFKLLTNSGMVTVFPPEYANMIRNERQLVFAKAFAHVGLKSYAVVICLTNLLLRILQPKCLVWNRSISLICQTELYRRYPKSSLPSP